ncbi:Immunoglobulin-like domain of spore germination [Nocardioides alpinus]|nr:Gmad2 immunoglobulin-like domain-containing protein [Nocardioides alpinus]SFB43300.1 Immunoglobulin-like domain of spore germination [Nocardioides alpinus]
MSTDRSWWTALAAALAVVGALAGCTSTGTEADAPSPPPSQAPSATSTQDDPTPAAEPGEERTSGRLGAAAAPPTGLVYYAGRRARTGELLLFAEQSTFDGRGDLLPATREATGGAPVDPDYTSLWSGGAIASVRLFWDGDEGYYRVRLRDGRRTRRPAGTSMREAHLAIQQVVWTLHSVGGIRAPVRFSTGRDDDPVTDLLGVPATGPDDTYLAAHHSGVLSAVNILTPADGSPVDGVVEVSGLAESFEGTVGVRVRDQRGRVVLEDGAQAEQCCGRLFPWTYVLDTTGWPSGTYTLEALTDDPVGIAQGSDGPEIETKTITIDQTE